MVSPPNDRFHQLFAEEQYLLLKNYLYNYLLRKRAIETNLRGEKPGLILEVGSGISPMITKTSRIIYSDISSRAMQILRNTHGKGNHVVADCINLPFRTGIFTHAVCSEVLEHMRDDQLALREIARVLRPMSKIIITFPHRTAYYAKDDHAVNHFRRYELSEMVKSLKAVGFDLQTVQKVLGPLDKVAMLLAVSLYDFIQKQQANNRTQRKRKPAGISVSLFRWANIVYAGMSWLESKLIPRSIATILLIKAEKVEPFLSAPSRFQS